MVLLFQSILNCVEDSVIPTKEQLVKGGETTSRYDEKLFQLKGVGSVKERLKFLQVLAIFSLNFAEKKRRIEGKSR